MSFRRLGRASRSYKVVEIMLIYTVKQRQILQTFLLKKQETADLVTITEEIFNGFNSFGIQFSHLLFSGKS